MNTLKINLTGIVLLVFVLGGFITDHAGRYVFSLSCTIMILFWAVNASSKLSKGKEKGVALQLDDLPVGTYRIRSVGNPCTGLVLLKDNTIVWIPRIENLSKRPLQANDSIDIEEDLNGKKRAVFVESTPVVTM